MNLRKDHCRRASGPGRRTHERTVHPPSEASGAARGAAAPAAPDAPSPARPAKGARGGGGRWGRWARARASLPPDGPTSRRGVRQGKTRAGGRARRRPSPGDGAGARARRAPAARALERAARDPRFKTTTRLPATDISALASMKNVAKCDTWCELQNPANHRIFERKLRPRPSGRGHACLGVTHPDAPRPFPARTPARRPRPARPARAARAGGARGRGEWPAAGAPERGARGGPKYEGPRGPRTRGAPRRVVGRHHGRRGRPTADGREERNPRAGACGARTATPGQAGLPAEFKHINKRRKRNLRGFP